MSGDERVTGARTLLAEHHQPLTMTPGDVRNLLARFQRRVAELLEVIDNPPITAVTTAGGAALTRTDVPAVLRALDDAVAWSEHAGLPARIPRYRALARALGDTRCADAGVQEPILGG